MKLRFVMSVTLAGAMLAAGCTGISSPTEPTDLSPGLVILDAEHGDEGSHFYFLPPMVPNPGATGIFDTTQPAAVQVCELIEMSTDCAGPPIAEFSVEAGTINVSLEDEHYIALWHAGDFELDLTKVYRIRISVGARELGYADVQPVDNGKALKSLLTEEVIGLVDDRTLPVKFRIEEGALGITIDATAMTASQFAISGKGLFLSATPVVLDLAPGTYSVQELSGGIHAFEVTATGDISYATEKEPYFDGVGTSQLTLVGYDINIDATALTPPNFFIGGLGIGALPSATVATLTFLPGGKSIQDGTGLGGVHAFEVTETGDVSYGPEKEPFFDGLNTSQLTVVGYDVIVDATAFTALTYFIGGIGGFSSSTVDTITFLPGGKSIQDGSGNPHAFEVTATGLVSYATEKEPYFDGVDTSQLTVVGYDIIIDAIALVAPTFSLGGIGSFPKTALQTVTTLPGTKSFSSTDVVFNFEVREDGLLDYDAFLDAILTGRNTTTLVVQPGEGGT